MVCAIPDEAKAETETNKIITMEHKIINGLHCIINAKGLVSVYTESEYTQMKWWNKLNLKSKSK